MRELLTDLYYKNINFDITITDPTGEYNSGAYLPKEYTYEICHNHSNRWVFECAYHDYVVIKCKAVRLQKNVWTYLTVSYKYVKHVRWDEPVEVKEEDVPF